MYVRNSSKKRKYLIVKLFGTRSCDGSLYVCSCRYNGCINRRDVHITFSIFGDFDDCHDKHVPHLHTHHASISYLIDINGDVHKKRYVMMYDVYLYHAHTFFLWCMMCVGTRTRMSTSVEHELTKRALESIPQVSSRSNPALIPFACFASFMLNNCAFLWFDYKHVDG